MGEPVQLIVRAVESGVRPVRMRLPFRFGASTLTACPQVFVRVDVEVHGQRRAQGYAADLMVPKWFDKRSGLSPATNVEHLAQSLQRASEVYLDEGPATPFALFCRQYPVLMREGHQHDITELSVAFGQSLIDRAVIDATCGSLGVSFFEAARRNLLGLGETPLAPDMHGWDWSNWLGQLGPLHSIETRHTVGMLDELDAVRYADDGLPVTLPSVIERYGHRYFKVKVGGDPVRDLERLRAVLSVLRQSAGDFRYTLDGNEQYADPEALLELLVGLRDLPAPLYIEQPMPREQSLVTPLPIDRTPAPLLMDEADATLDAFVRGREFGWTGVSSKSCKGLYKSLINRARCERWNRDQGATSYFMSAEDLTCQAGLSVQQDLALVALLGLTHSERNGHYYGDGVDASPAEQRAFCAAHPDLYDDVAGHLRLRIRRGAVQLDSLFQAGFAHRADPDFSALQPLAAATALI
jgi:hypothetical protein